MQSFYPCTQKLKETSVNVHSLSSAAAIIKLAQSKSHSQRNPFQQLSATISELKQDENQEDYFNFNVQEVQTMINQLNVQCTLSKKQLNQLDQNGYYKLKVCIVWKLDTLSSLISTNGT